MNVYFKFDFNTVCSTVLKNMLDKNEVKYRLVGFGEIELLDTLPQSKVEALTDNLKVYGIEIVQNQKSIIVQRIKDAIKDMVFNENTNLSVKSSVYLSEKLGHSYGHLANIFSEVTYTSIENYIIIQRIEYTKQLIINENLSLTEISFKLNYSSVAHLSAQFKKATGITPSAFQRIIEKRKARIK